MYRKTEGKNKNSAEVWTEEEHEKYLADLYGFEFVADYTANGFPFGIMADEKDHLENFEKCEPYSLKNQPPTGDEYLPF